MSNIENLRDIIENYSEELKHLPSSEIENLQALLEDIKDKPKSIWDLDIAGGKEYYVLWTDGHIDANDFISHLDEKKRDMGNAFLTREEAEFELERRKIEAIMKKHSRPFKYEEDNYHLKYFCRSGSICILNSWEFNDGLLYFESKEIARKVIDEIGIDRLKKYWFRVK
jgi:hypothetical protein|nr:hypothetical protein [uncultured Peptostreptococcus sp.]